MEREGEGERGRRREGVGERERERKGERENQQTRSSVYLSIADSIPVDDDAVWEGSVDLMIFPQCVGHAHLEVVGHLLSSVLKHHLTVVSAR